MPTQLHALVYTCRYEKDLDRQIDILFQINRFLPSNMQLKLPSLFTDDYIRTALDAIEEKLIAISADNSKVGR